MLFSYSGSAGGRSSQCRNVCTVWGGPGTFLTGRFLSAAILMLGIMFNFVTLEIQVNWVIWPLCTRRRQRAPAAGARQACFVELGRWASMVCRHGPDWHCQKLQRQRLRIYPVLGTRSAHCMTKCHDMMVPLSFALEVQTWTMMCILHGRVCKTASGQATFRAERCVGMRSTRKDC